MTAVARVSTVDEPHRLASQLAPAALCGSVDFSALEPGTEVEPREFGSEMLLIAPGLALRFDVARVRAHVSRAAITLIVGRARIDGQHAAPEDVNALLLEDTDRWRRLGGRFAIVRIDLVAGGAQLITDRFGACPLAWSRQGPRLGFSDRADRVPLTHARTIDPQAIFDYVYFHTIPSPRTVFTGIHRMEPATALHVSAIELSARPTWQPAFRSTPSRGAGDLHQRFREAVRDAVVDEADGAAAGCFLSGGTDSSTVAGMLARERGHALTFSIGFDAAGYDEMEYARIAARHFGTEHHAYYVTPADVVRSVPLVAAHYDQPFGNSSAVPAYICSLMARHHGVQRMLAGDGGDELFGGNLRYARQNVFEAYQRVPRVLQRALVEPLLANRVAQSAPGVRKAASYVVQARVPMPARTETYNLLARFGAGNVFTPRFLERIDPSAPAALQANVYARYPDASFVDRMLAYDWRFTLADNDLPKVTGTTAMAGLDAAFPLLADAIVDLSTELGATDKVNGLQLRCFFKQALADFLPAEILAKKKHGFGLPVGSWLVSDTDLRALGYDALRSLTDRGLIQQRLVDDLFSRRLEEHPGYYGEMVWVLMMLEHWLRSHEPSWSCR